MKAGHCVHVALVIRFFEKANSAPCDLNNLHRQPKPMGLVGFDEVQIIVVISDLHSQSVCQSRNPVSMAALNHAFKLTDMLD